MTLGSQGFWTRPGSFIFDPIYKQHDGQKEKCRSRLYEVLFPRSLTIPIGPHAYEKRIKRAFVFHASTSTPSPHYKGVKTRDANLDDYIAGLGLVFSFFCAPTFPRSFAIHTFHPVLYTYIYRTTSWIFHTAHAFATGKKTKLPGGAVPSETRRRASLGVHPPARPCKDTCAVFWLAIIGASLHLKCRHKYLDNLSTSIIHTHLAPGSRNSVGIAFLDTHSGFLGFNSHQVTFFLQLFFSKSTIFQSLLIKLYLFFSLCAACNFKRIHNALELKSDQKRKIFNLFSYTHKKKNIQCCIQEAVPKSVTVVWPLVNSAYSAVCSSLRL